MRITRLQCNAAIAWVLCCLGAEAALVAEFPIEEDDYNYQDAANWYVEHPVCDGVQQSPVELSLKTATPNDRRNDTVCGKYMCLKDRFHIAPLRNASEVRPKAQLRNSGHHLVLEFPHGSVPWYMNSTGRLYNLYDIVQLIFHFPAEHVVDGRRYPGELQIITRNPTRRKVAISVLLSDDVASAPSHFFQQLGLPDSLPKAGWARRVDASHIDIKSELEESLAGSFFRYDGSLTVPPCTEDVYWLVMRKPAPLLWPGAAKKFQSVLGPTARPAQPLGKRAIMLDSIIVMGAAESVGYCPEPDDAGAIGIIGCVRTCRVNPKFLDEDGYPTGRISCPEPCPIQAPCSAPGHIRCIVGSDAMDDILKESGVVPWTAPTLRDSSYCKFYNPVSQADLENRACITCRVSMCEVCKSDAVCKKCLAGYKISADGTYCVDTWTPVWWCVYPLVILGLLFYICWLVSLSFRPSHGEDDKLLNAAILSKWLVRPRDFTSRRGTTFSPWMLWEWHCGDRLGAGVTAFFNFMWLVILTVLATGLIHYYYEARHPELLELTGAAAGAANVRCALIQQPPRLLQDEAYYTDTITSPMLRCALAVYGSTLFLTFIFAERLYALKHRSQRFSERNKISTCCVVLESLPSDAPVDLIESWVVSLLKLRGHSAEELVGASLVYRAPKQDEQRFEEVFREAINMIVEEADEYLEFSFTGTPEGRTPCRSRCSCTSFSLFHALDGICGYDFSSTELPQDGSVGWRVGPSLQRLRGSGAAHVVFRSEAAARDFLAEANKATPQHSQSLTQNWSWLTGRNRDDVDPKEIQILRMPLLPEKTPEEPAVPLHFAGLQYYPFATQRRGAPQSVAWDQYGLKISEVKTKVWDIPQRVAKSFLLMLAFLLPSNAFFAKHARSTADASGWQWQLQTQVLGFVVGLGYQFMGGSAWEVSRNFGATTVEKQRMVMFCYIVCCAGVLTGANLFFTLKVMTPAWIEHMIQMGERPTVMGAQVNTLFNTIWPGSLAIGYCVEPLMGVLIPQYVNYNVCRSRGGTRTAAERSVRFPQVDPTWQCADLVVNTTLCFSVMFFVGDHVWEACLHYSIILCARYFYLAVTWAATATKQVFSTTEQVEMAYEFWVAVPVGCVAMVVGHWSAKHMLGLSLPPVGLPNGPATDPNAWAVQTRRLMTFAALCINLFATKVWLLPLARALAHSQSSKAETNNSYEEARQVSPADYFNTNSFLVLLVQSVCHGDPVQLASKLPKEIKKRGLLKFAEVFLKCADEARTYKNQTAPSRLGLKAQSIALAAFWIAATADTSKDSLLKERVRDPPKYLQSYDGSRFEELVYELKKRDNSLLQRVLKHHNEQREKLEPPPQEFLAAIKHNARSVLMPFVDGKEYLQGGSFATYYENLRRKRPRKIRAYFWFFVAWGCVVLAAFRVPLDRLL